MPETLDTSVYDEVITVTNEDAFATRKELARTDGVLTGISSGAALWAAHAGGTAPGKRRQDHRGPAAGHGGPLPLHPLFTD